jgi:O-antigen ligase
MKLVIGSNQRGPVASSAVVLLAFVVLVLTVFSGADLKSIAPIIALVMIIAFAYQRLLKWRSLVAMIVFVILFIPMKRYTLPASLPINLEPYRLLVAVVAVGWITSLLIDPRVRLRSTPIDTPLRFFALAVVLSEIANRHRVATVQSEVIKKLLFFLSFFIVLYLIVSVVRRFEDIDFVVRTLVAGGAVVAFFALIERDTGYDVFNHLHTIVPFLHLDTANIPIIPARGGRLRVFASAQHPIALGAALAMLVPLAVYRAKSYGQRRWWGAALLLTLGSLSTGSRTAIVMIGVIALVYFWLRRAEVKRFWPALIPALLAIHFAAPGSLGTIKESFFPRGGIIAQQTNANVGSGRIATLWPALHAEFSPNPLVGEGFGSRVTTPTPAVPKPNAPILDDQWLGILLETGLFGALALLWMFVRFIRRLAPVARDDDSPRGWFLVSCIASVAGFASTMLFYDAFSFIQVTFMLFIIMGLGISALLVPERALARSRQPVPRPGSVGAPAASFAQPRGDLA